MKRFKIKWSETLIYEQEIEAENRDEAEVKFNSIPQKELNVVDSIGGQDFEIEEIKE